MKKVFYLLIGSLLLGIGLVGCSKAIDSKTQTVVLQKTGPSESRASNHLSTFIFVRHAEKKSDGKNPNLTTVGTERAEALARVLTNIPIDRVYSTNYHRTAATATPTAQSKNLETVLYNPSDLVAFQQQLIKEVPNGTALIVGHSNTTPDLINLFLKDPILIHLSEKAYDDLFILTVPQNGQAKLLQLKYGEEVVSGH